MHIGVYPRKEKMRQKDKINKTANMPSVVETKAKKEKKGFLTRFVCIFLAIVLVFGGAMAIMIGIRESRAVIKYDNVYMSEGVTRFFVSRFKTIYLASLNGEGISAKDTATFWAQKDSEGVSYGDRFADELKDYLASIVAANRIFKAYGNLTSDDKDCITKSAAEVLKYKANGSVDEFNSMSSKYGFDYSDFEKATEMLYCAEKASMMIYGTDGKNLSSSPELCAEYLESYSHVHLAFVRTETKLVITENENGTSTEQILPLTEEEKLARSSLIAKITEMINNRNEENSGVWISTTAFEELQKNYDSDPAMLDTGYYFKSTAAATVEFAEEFASVVERSYGMEIGEYARVDLPIGVCFIYKDEPDAFAYLDNSNVFLSDFYSDGADYFYAQTLIEFSQSVVFTALYSERIDPIGIPKNSDLYVRGWVS